MKTPHSNITVPIHFEAKGESYKVIEINSQPYYVVFYNIKTGVVYKTCGYTLSEKLNEIQKNTKGNYRLK
jgi:hypothetical protein